MSRTERHVSCFSRLPGGIVIPSDSTGYATSPPVPLPSDTSTRLPARLTVMLTVFLRAYFWLIKFDFGVTRKDFRRIQEEVRNCPTALRTRSIGMMHPKEVLCLQRSSALTCLLRSYGISASMLFGAQIMPFRAHAWVEVDGQLINEGLNVRGEFGVLDCL
jgi:hypothetical protein